MIQRFQQKSIYAMKYSMFYTFLISTAMAGQAQKESTMTNNNPLLCNPQTGLCELPVTPQQSENTTKVSTEKPIKILYFTDPICSSCWGIEPQLRKLKLEYGPLIDIEYHMGGLLPDWSYNSGGISKPSDVAHHWDEASVYYDMPIDGDVWLNDPLNSSYPASIAFKAAEMQDKQKAVLFMREVREMVFLHQKNIAKWEVLEQAAKNVQLDVVQLKKDYDGKAQELFKADLEITRNHGVRGFPTLLFIGSNQQKETLYGSKPYASFEMLVAKMAPDSVKSNYVKDWKHLFGHYSSLTAREFTELAELPRKEAESLLNQLTAEGVLEKFQTKNGALWKLK